MAAESQQLPQDSLHFEILAKHEVMAATPGLANKTIMLAVTTETTESEMQAAAMIPTSSTF